MIEPTRRASILSFVTLCISVLPVHAEVRCRLTPAECLIVARELDDDDAKMAYEASIPSSRRPYQQREFLLDRAKQRSLEKARRMPAGIAREYARQGLCESVERLIIAGGNPKGAYDCP